MFRLYQAWAPKVGFCSDSSSGLQKTQIYLDQPIRPQKWSIFLQLPQKSTQTANVSQIKLLSAHIVSIIHHVLLYSRLHHFHNILKPSLQLIEYLDMSFVKGECLVILAGCWYCNQGAKEMITMETRQICPHVAQHFIECEKGKFSFSVANAFRDIVVFG